MGKGLSLTDALKAGDFDGMTDAEKDGQAITWALLFIISEVAGIHRNIFDALADKDIFTSEELEKLAKGGPQDERIIGYNQIEKIFQDKYDRVRYVMDNAEAVAAQALDAQGEMPWTTTST